MLTPGSTIIFSAGGEKLNPEQFRLLTESKNEHISTMAKHFPFLITFVSPYNLPLIINCYPAPIGNFPNMLYTDTYLRWNNFARALLLAEKEKMTAGIIGQPLVVLDLLLRYKKSGYPFPTHILIGLGGYDCPALIEKMINEIVGNSQPISCVFYGYGIGELAFNCLMGMRTEDKIIYYPAMEDIKPTIKDSVLYLNEFNTGDFAELVENGGFLIQQPPKKLHPEIKTVLNQWTFSDWERRTGFITYQDNGFIFQLRPGTKSANKNELSFYEYAERFGFSWSDKPNWGLAS